MGMPRSPGKVKLIAGLLFNDAEKYAAAKGSLIRLFGKVDFESETLEFNYTSYYDAEMGGALQRKFLSFERLHDMKNIGDLKIRTNKLESRYSVSGKRTVNIDPGYVDSAKLILFSTKDYSHRIYLGNGIFAENALFYKDGTFMPWPWTYPDYRSSEYLNVFESIRRLYRNQLTDQ